MESPSIIEKASRDPFIFKYDLNWVCINAGHKSGTGTQPESIICPSLKFKIRIIPELHYAYTRKLCLFSLCLHKTDIHVKLYTAVKIILYNAQIDESVFFTDAFIVD